MEHEIQAFPRIQGKCAYIENRIIVGDKLLLVHLSLCADMKEDFANLSYVWITLDSLKLFNAVVKGLIHNIFPLNYCFFLITDVLVIVLWTTQLSKIFIIGFHLRWFVNSWVWNVFICWCPASYITLSWIFSFTFANVIFETSGIAKTDDWVTCTYWNWCKYSCNFKSKLLTVKGP